MNRYAIYTPHPNLNFAGVFRGFIESELELETCYLSTIDGCEFCEDTIPAGQVPLMAITRSSGGMGLDLEQPVWIVKDEP